MRERAALLGKILAMIALAAALISIGYSFRDDPSFVPAMRRSRPARNPTPDPSAQAAPSASSRAIPGAGELSPIVTPDLDLADSPAPAGDLRAEIAAFTDVRSCVKRHATDALVGDGLEAIGYDSFLGDLCRGIQAMKEHDVTPCNASLSSSMKRSCMRQVAMLHGDPSLCPIDEPRRRVLSHDRLCLAVARRDVRPCSSLPTYERIACEALVAHDVARCGTEPRCLRLVQRWMPALPSTVGVTPYAGHISVELRGVDDRADAGASIETVDLAADAVAGAVLIVRHDGLTLHFGALESVLRPSAPLGGFLVDLPATPVTSQEISLNDRQALALIKFPSGLDLSLASKPSVKVLIERLDREPNGIAKLKIEAMMGTPGTARLARWAIDTWVRDVVTAPDAPPAH